MFDIFERRFVCYFHFVGWTCISAGFHVDFASPNVELHVPFGFFRLGWQGVYGRKRKFFTIGRDWFWESWFTIR